MRASAGTGTVLALHDPRAGYVIYQSTRRNMPLDLNLYSNIHLTTMFNFRCVTLYSITSDFIVLSHLTEWSPALIWTSVDLTRQTMHV